MDATSVGLLQTALTDQLTLLIPLVAAIFAFGFGVNAAIRWSKRAGK